MAVTDQDVQRMVVNEVGDVDPQTAELLAPLLSTDALISSSGLLAQQIALFWDAYADKAQVTPRLQEASVKLRCIDSVLGRLQDLVPETGGAADAGVVANARIATLQAMRKDALAERDRIEKGALVSWQSAVGTLTTVTPAAAWPPQPPPLVPDASDARYGGWPYRTPPAGVV